MTGISNQMVAEAVYARNIRALESWVGRAGGSLAA